MNLGLPVSLVIGLTPWSWLSVHGQPGHIAGIHQVNRPGNDNECSIVGDNSAFCSSGDFFADMREESLNDPEPLVVQEGEEEDPMLETMPGLNFKAYKRADISSFYQEPPGSRVEKTPAFQGKAGKFVNMSPERLDLLWDDGQGAATARHICSTGPFESCGTSTFPSHVFHFVRPKTQEVVCSFRVEKEHSVYYCDPFTKYDRNDLSAGVLAEEVKSTETLFESEKELYDAAVFNRNFGPMYKNFTGGNEWLGQFPTEKPKHYMWRADYFGQQHHVETAETHFAGLPPADLLHKMSLDDMRNKNTTSLPLQEWREETGSLNLTLTVVSVAPRIIQIDGFLSDVEVDHILSLAQEKNMARSTTGMSGKEAHVSTVRTSRTTWLPRHSSPIMNAIIRRGADVLKIDEALLRRRLDDEEFPDIPSNNAINEDLQIVHYGKGQQYTAHHDFGYPDTRPNAPSRSINLCMYLNEGMEGGETAFPRWRNAETDDAVNAVPKRGKAMIFYMKMPDGNLDDLSQHAAMPVIEGEKWFSNLWIWDPVRA